MKTSHPLFITMLLIVVFSLTWISCEKDNDTSVLSTSTEIDAPTEPTASTVLENISSTTDFTIPDSVSAYLTDEQIEALYQEVRSAPEKSSGWKMTSVFMKIRTNVVYTGNVKFPSAIVFSGNGTWKPYGYVRYYEKVNFGPFKSMKWTGKGSLLLKTKPPVGTVLGNNLTQKNELMFLSGNRSDQFAVNGIPEAVKLATPTKVVDSQLQFTGGKGIFKGAFGKAYKVEKYFKSKPYCESFVYGVLWIKTKEEVKEVADYDVK